MHSWEKGEGGELEPALTRTPPGPICSAHRYWWTAGRTGGIAVCRRQGTEVTVFFAVGLSAAPGSPGAALFLQPPAHRSSPGSQQRPAGMLQWVSVNGLG